MSKVFAKIFLTFLISLNEYSKADNNDYMKEPPTFTTPCYFSNPKFDECMIKQTQQLFNQLSQGIPGLKTVRSTDPYYINRVKFNQGNRNVMLKTVLTNVIIKGLKDVKVEFCTVSNKDFSWDAKFFIPKLKFEANYDIDGKILIVPIKGNGKMFLEMDNMRLMFHANTFLYKRDNFTFYNVTGISGDVISLGNLKTDLQNLFGGNKELERSTNEFFNENWRDVFEAMKPLIKQTVEEIVYDVIKRIYTFIPANHFIPDIPTPSD